MGFTQLSMNPLSIPAIRKVLHEIPMESSRQLAQKALTFATAHEVHKYLVDTVSKMIPWDLSAYVNEISPSQNGLNT